MTALNKTLLVLLVVQLGLVGLCSRRDQAGTIGRLEPLLPEYDAESVSRVQIFATAGAEAPAVDVLSKDGEWVLASHFDYPADETAVTSLVGKIASMQSRGPATTTASGHKRLKVADDDFVRKLVLTNAAGDTTLYLGMSPKFKKLNVRIAGSDETHLVQHLTAQDAGNTMSSWIDPLFLAIPEETMAALTIENAAGAIALEKDAEQRWQLAEGAALPPAATGPASIDQGAVSEIAKKLAKIEIEGAVGVEARPEFGLTEPKTRITVGMAGDSGDEESPAREIRVIEIGAVQGGNYYLRVLDKPHIVTVKEEALKDLVEATLEKVLDKAAPAPVLPKP